jgi:group I intron endonuclease
MKGVIYQIKNKKNGKVYIGSTTDWERRKSRHIKDLKNGNHHNITVQRAWEKYGEEAFNFEILEKVDNPKQREQEILDNQKPFWDNGGYNISSSASGGDLITNHPNREEIEKRRNEATRKRFANMTEKERKEKYGHEKENNGNWKGGKTYCDCGNKKNLEAEKCEECYDKSGKNNPFYGKSHTEEAKQKIREAKKGEYNGSQNKRVTNGEKTFKSLGEAARSENVSAGAIHNRLNKETFPKWEYV